MHTIAQVDEREFSAPHQQGNQQRTPPIDCQGDGGDMGISGVLRRIEPERQQRKCRQCRQAGDNQTLATALRRIGRIRAFRRKKRFSHVDTQAAELYSALITMMWTHIDTWTAQRQFSLGLEGYLCKIE